ncbi:hypothetical protein BH23THE1_BH23THE1_31730 [soil metagenome]
MCNIVEEKNNQIKNQSSKEIEILTRFVKFENDIQIFDLTDLKGKEKEEVIIYADKTRLTQVFYNLLDNAIRFTQHGKITINIIEKISNLDVTNADSLEADRRSTPIQKAKTGEIIVQVVDSGRGTDPKILPYLFTKFISDPAMGETGLGLFISKNIIEAHGGRIWAEHNNNDESKKGATFSFSLPFGVR